MTFFLLYQYLCTDLNSLRATQGGFCVQKWWLPMNFCTCRSWYNINMANSIVICAQGTGIFLIAFDSAGDWFLEFHSQRWDACSHLISDILFVKYQPVLSFKFQRRLKKNPISKGKNLKDWLIFKEPVSFSRKFKRVRICSQMRHVKQQDFQEFLAINVVKKVGWQCSLWIFL